MLYLSVASFVSLEIEKVLHDFKQICPSELSIGFDRERFRRRGFTPFFFQPLSDLSRIWVHELVMPVAKSDHCSVASYLKCATDYQVYFFTVKSEMTLPWLAEKWLRVAKLLERQQYIDEEESFLSDGSRDDWIGPEGKVNQDARQHLQFYKDCLSVADVGMCRRVLESWHSCIAHHLRDRVTLVG